MLDIAVPAGCSARAAKLPRPCAGNGGQPGPDGSGPTDIVGVTWPVVAGPLDPGAVVAGVAAADVVLAAASSAPSSSSLHATAMRTAAATSATAPARGAVFTPPLHHGHTVGMDPLLEKLQFKGGRLVVLRAREAYGPDDLIESWARTVSAASRRRRGRRDDK
jgi:hypothetical protein